MMETSQGWSCPTPGFTNSTLFCLKKEILVSQLPRTGIQDMIFCMPTKKRVPVPPGTGTYINKSVLLNQSRWRLNYFVEP